MLKQFNEKDFYILKEVSQNRLKPPGIIVFSFGAMFYSGIMTLVFWNAVRGLTLETNFWTNIMNVMYVLLFIQFVLTIFFASDKRAYKYQKAQSYFLAAISLKISVEVYLLYFLSCADKGAPTYMTTVGLFFLGGGFVFLFLSIIRTINRVKQGEFKENGRGIFNYKESKGYVNIPIIYAATIFGGLLARAIPSMGLSTVGELIFPLILSVFMQHLIAIAWPEFLLLAYCKKRFPSFNYIPAKYR
jgi:hypothetical protein